MKRFIDKLENLLKKDLRFVDKSGDLLLNAVKDKAWSLDHNLIELLLTDKEIEGKFFDEINGRCIFNYNTFVTYITSRSIDNSYTRFCNKIGLNIDGKSMQERGEVSLVWPYKDCVLEGGQTKDMEERTEIFFNEILAQDEITRLFDPKVLTGWAHHTAKGIKKVKEIKRDENGTIRENLIIKGNNLIALHTLKQQFCGKIKLIYIDPPYNTRGDANIFGYNNSFNHSSWLTFMRNRLNDARHLLLEDGCVCVAIDDYEYAHLKLVCDEVFGSENYIGTVVVQSKPSGRTTNTHFATCHEYALFYAKAIENIYINTVKLTAKQKLVFKYEDKISKYQLSPFRRSGGYSTPDERPNSFYPIYYGDKNNELSLEKKPGFIEILPIDSQGKKRVWRQTRPSFLKLVEKGDIVCKKSTKNNWVLYIKDRIPEGRKPKTIWADPKYDASAHGTNLLKKLFDGQKVFSYPKSIHTVKDVIQLLTQPDGNNYVLDFFAGSGTTAHAVLELNKEDGGSRQFILVEQLEQHIDVCKKRLGKVITNDTAIRGDFLSCELMPYNQSFIDKIQTAKSSKEIEKIWKDIAGQSFLNWYVNTDQPEKALCKFMEIGKLENGLIKQKETLIKLLDKNQLYVNKSEIDDKDFDVSKEDKYLNEEFYDKKISV